MSIIRYSLLFLVICISNISSKEDSVNKANVENLKILRNGVNFAYKAGNNFLDLIRGTTPPHISIQRAIKAFGNKNNFKLSDLIPVYLPYTGYICLTLAGLIFVIMMPIVGFCFCCCRCAGKCGGRIKGMDPKHATCKRYIYALFLGIISFVQLAGIVLAFINNQLIHDTLTSPSAEISAVKQFSQGFHTLKVSLMNISDAINESEKSTQNTGDSDISGANFLDMTCKGYMTVLKSDVSRLNNERDLIGISNALDDSVNYIRKVKQNNEKLEKYASDIKNEISKLRTKNIQSKICKTLSPIVDEDLKGLKNIMRQQIKSGPTTGSKLLQIVASFNYTTEIVSNRFDIVINEFMKVEYLEYRMYVFIGICCLLLLIVLFYLLGLCFGQCGERPFEDARICNRGVGANLLMAGVAFAFLFTGLIMILEMALFSYGGMAQTEICRYVSDADKPSVSTFDKILQMMPEFKGNRFVELNILESIFNKCATEPMAVAFDLDNNLMSADINTKIREISAKVRKLPTETKQEICNDYFLGVERLLSNITTELEVSQGNFDGFDAKTKQTILDKLTTVITFISKFSLPTRKDQFLDSFNDAAEAGFNRTLRQEVKNVLSNIYLSSYSNVKCDGISKSAKTIADAFCITFLWPFNGFWYGVGICLIFTIPGIIFAVKLVGLYRRTEKYSADYEEPVYNTYMGFYTNNAENIPMKRPKSAKSNNKNRNSNSNNKDSMKQNNPQYLPVYPYDAYE